MEEIRVKSLSVYTSIQHSDDKITIDRFSLAVSYYAYSGL